MTKIKTFWSKFKDLTVFLLVVVLISVVVDMTVISFAEETSTTEEEIDGTFDCYAGVTEALVAADMDLTEFLNDAFTSAEPTSEIIDLVIEKYYIEYASNMESALSEAMATEGGENLTEVLEDIDECAGIIDKHMDVNEQIMTAQVATSAAGKKTTALLDEYKYINERLEAMNLTVGKIAGLLEKVKTNMPKFTKNCVKQ